MNKFMQIFLCLGRAVPVRISLRISRFALNICSKSKRQKTIKNFSVPTSGNCLKDFVWNITSHCVILRYISQHAETTN
jgi:hypothetical protein